MALGAGELPNERVGLERPNALVLAWSGDCADGCGWVWTNTWEVTVCSVGDLRISMLFCFGYVCSVGDCGCDSAVSVAVLCCSLTLHYLTSVRDVTV